MDVVQSGTQATS